jgi:CrcB protein
MPAPTHVILLALAGAAGTLLRAGCTAVAIRLVGVGFPWGTLAVNVAGSCAFGVLAGLARSRGLLGPVQESILLVGLLGGFTTYSSFAFQTVELLAAGRPVAAAAYVLATNAAALAAVWAGLRLGGA